MEPTIFPNVNRDYFLYRFVLTALFTFMLGYILFVQLKKAEGGLMFAGFVLGFFGFIYMYSAPETLT